VRTGPPCHSVHLTNLYNQVLADQLADRLVLLERGEKMGQTPHDGAPAGA
jgi:hypothetical protein